MELEGWDRRFPAYKVIEYQSVLNQHQRESRENVSISNRFLSSFFSVSILTPKIDTRRFRQGRLKKKIDTGSISVSILRIYRSYVLRIYRIYVGGFRIYSYLFFGVSNRI